MSCPYKGRFEERAGQAPPLQIGEAEAAASRGRDKEDGEVNPPLQRARKTKRDSSLRSE
jgi:hypothetical protein